MPKRAGWIEKIRKPYLECISDSCSGDTGKLKKGARGSANARRALGRRGPSEETFAAPEPARHQSQMQSLTDD